MDTRILLVDDDVELATLLRDYLTREGYSLSAAHRGPEGLEQARSGGYAVVILDIMLPEMSGLDVLRALRTESDVPVLMLTARGDDVDRIVGLEMGADDYLPKPFNPRELLARLRAIQRRTEVAQRASGTRDELSVGDLALNVGARIARCGGQTLALTSVEFALLHLLLSTPGQVVSREAICERALGRRFSPFDRSIDVHVSNLRKKLGPGPQDQNRIKTVRGAGYVLVEHPG